MATNPLSALANWWNPTALEADVILFIAKAKAGLSVAIADVKAVFSWLDANAGTIANDIGIVLKLAGQLGVAGNPQLAVLVASANIAVTALNTYAADRAAGANHPQAAIAGYLAVTKAQQLHAQVGQALASATYAPVSTPAVGLADLYDGGPIDVKMVPPK